MKSQEEILIIKKFLYNTINGDADSAPFIISKSFDDKLFDLLFDKHIFKFGDNDDVKFLNFKFNELDSLYSQSAWKDMNLNDIIWRINYESNQSDGIVDGHILSLEIDSLKGFKTNDLSHLFEKQYRTLVSYLNIKLLSQSNNRWTTFSKQIERFLKCGLVLSESIDFSELTKSINRIPLECNFNSDSYNQTIRLIDILIFIYCILTEFLRNPLQSTEKDSIVSNGNDLGYEDKFGLFKEYYKIDKSKLNYDNIKNEMLISSDKSKFIINNIPKDLLYSRKQLIDILINQIIVVNQNIEYKHFIIHKENFKFELNLFLPWSCKIEIVIDPNLYPFYPPKFMWISPDVKSSFQYSISNLSISKLENWNPTISIEWLILKFYDNLKKINYSDIEKGIHLESKAIDSSYTENFKISFDLLQKELMEFSMLTNIELQNEWNFNFDYSKFDITKNSDGSDSKYWQQGVGYGYRGRNDWNLSKYVENLENNNKLKKDKLESINKCEALIIKPDTLQILMESIFFKLFLKFIDDSFNNTTILEMDKNLIVINELINVISTIFESTNNSEFTGICNTNHNIELNRWKFKICKSIRSLKEEISLILESIENAEKLNVYIFLISTYDKIKDWESIYKLNGVNIFGSIESEQCTSLPGSPNTITNQSNTVESLYEKIILKFQDNLIRSDFEIDKNHRFYKNIEDVLKPKGIYRITSELSSLKKNLPNNWDTSVIMASPKSKLNIFTFLVTGPKDTPYHNGVFEFHGCFPDDYPSSEPKVLLDTTGNGEVRFNPNLYACGKVCLSLLGTWSGSGAEKWNSSNSTFLQVLVSIQSLIFVEQPYFNEPGWERQMHSLEGKRKSFDYNDNLRLQTLKWAINDRFENPPKGFEIFTKFHFLMKKNEILAVTKNWVEESSNKHQESMMTHRKELLRLYKEFDKQKFIEDITKNSLDFDESIKNDLKLFVDSKLDTRSNPMDSLKESDFSQIDLSSDSNPTDSIDSPNLNSTKNKVVNIVNEKYDVMIELDTQSSEKSKEEDSPISPPAYELLEDNDTTNLNLLDDDSMPSLEQVDSDQEV